MKEIWIRITNESPSFFKRIQAIGGTLIGIGIAIEASPIVLPAFILGLSTHLITAGTIATIVAKCAVTDNEVLPKKD